jgi:hypothetical protein
VEIIFLIAGLALIAVGVAIIASEAKARRGTEPTQAKVIGFSHGKSINANVASFHSIAEYVGRNGRRYYVEGSVGSSVPLHAVGQPVTVLINPREPENAVLKSPLSYVLGGVLALLGAAAIAAFWMTFRLNLFSGTMAAIIVAGLAANIWKAWRKEPLTLEAWNAYKKQVFSTRVFTEESKDQIFWAEPTRVASAIDAHRKSNRLAVPFLLVLGLGLLFLGYHFYGETERFLAMADHAIGTVIDLRENDSSDGQSTYSAVVEYSDDRGGSFKFVDSFSSSPPYYQTGETVHVLYDREDPKDAQIDRGLANYWLTALFVAFGGMFLLMGVNSARKRFRQNWA